MKRDGCQDFDNLRNRAESILAASPEALCEMTPEDVRTLVHDLAVHQIELELQNEELLNAQMQIERTRDELARLYHQAPVGYLTLNRSGTIERCNQTFATMVGKEADLLINRPLTDLLDDPERAIFLGRFRAFCKQPADKSMELYFPARGTCKGFHGRLTASFGTGSTKLNGDSEPSLLVIVQDVTDLKRVQECMSLAKEAAEQASRAKSEFLANMSHELRTPMNGVLGMAQLLEMTELTPEQQEFVSIITRSGNGLLKIIGDILDLSKIEAQHVLLEQRGFSLRDTVSQAVNLLRPQAQAKGLSIFTRIAPDLPDHFRGDQNRLGQVLSNLVSNAIKFTSRGSVSITVLAGSVEGSIYSLRFSVKDTGMGIPSASLHKLFIPFSQVDSSTTRRFGGTGLGLAISKQLIELMGGDIGVESVEGGGSIFFFRLPLEMETEPSRPEVPPLAVVDKGIHCPERYRILLVEDDPLNQKLIDTMLRKMGYQRGVAPDGHEAVSLLQTEAFDLVLMDCSMPVMDGYMATGKIRDPATGLKNPQIPIIALTARAMQGDREKCLEAGMNDYLTKPVKLTDLAESLKRWLPQKPA